jgi:hypothetical protein
MNLLDLVPVSERRHGKDSGRMGGLILAFLNFVEEVRCRKSSHDPDWVN